MSRRKKRFSIIRLLLSLVLIAVLFVAGAFLALALTEYKPADVEAIDLPSGTDRLAAGQSMTIVSFNTGYAALGEDADFFMDGGKTTRPESASVVQTNMQGIAGILSGLDADIYLLQEVDTDSKRSYGINEVEHYGEQLGLEAMFAYNFKTFYTYQRFPII